VTAAVIVAGLVALVAIAALWDGVRRALASQTRRAELRYDAATRAELEALRASLAALSTELDSVKAAVYLRGATKR
jgi:hypothetical protein